jgi:hypothetical protein
MYSRPEDKKYLTGERDFFFLNRKGDPRKAIRIRSPKAKSARI